MLTEYFGVFICNCRIPVKIMQLNKSETRSQSSVVELWWSKMSRKRDNVRAKLTHDLLQVDICVLFTGKSPKVLLRSHSRGWKTGTSRQDIMSRVEPIMSAEASSVLLKWKSKLVFVLAVLKRKIWTNGEQHRAPSWHFICLQTCKDYINNVAENGICSTSAARAQMQCSEFKAKGGTGSDVSPPVLASNLAPNYNNSTVSWKLCS